MDIVFSFGWLQPDPDEFRRWLNGEGTTMPLSMVRPAPSTGPHVGSDHSYEP